MPSIYVYTGFNVSTHTYNTHIDIMRQALVDLVSHDYYHNRDLFFLALDTLNKASENKRPDNKLYFSE